MRFLSSLLFLGMLALPQFIRCQHMNNPLFGRDTLSYQYDHIVGGMVEDSRKGYLIRTRGDFGTNYIYVFKSGNDSVYTGVSFIGSGDSLVNFFYENGVWIRYTVRVPDNSSGFNTWRITGIISQPEPGNEYLPLGHKEVSTTFIHSKYRLDSIFFDHQNGLLRRSVSSISHTGEVKSDIWSFRRQFNAVTNPGIVDSILSGIPYDRFSTAFNRAAQIQANQQTNFHGLTFYSFENPETETTLSEWIDSGKVVILDFWYIGCKHCHKFQNALAGYLEENQLWKTNISEGIAGSFPRG